MKLGIYEVNSPISHVCQIFSRSVQGLRSSDTPKIAISHPIDLLRAPYNSVALPCDTVFVQVTEFHLP